MKIVKVLTVSALLSVISLPAMAEETAHGSVNEEPSAAQSMPMMGSQQGGMPMMGGRQGGMPMMGGQQGGMPMMHGQHGGMPMMAQKHSMMRNHMQIMEWRLANIEALLTELVELQKR